MGCGTSVPVEQVHALQLELIQSQELTQSQDAGHCSSGALSVLLEGVEPDISDQHLIDQLNSRASLPEDLPETHCFIPNSLDHLKSEDLQKVWCKLRANTLPEYATANEVICIRKKWVIHSM